MSKIKVMNESLSNKIAAGEVIENQASVVKELVENSIDAKATKVEITLVDSGFQLIQVIDNGYGISKEDIKTAFMPHATSKIYFDYDLFNISSLGFRGEALPSIASIAKVEASSKPKDEKIGYTFNVNDNVISEGYSNQGTSISVYNLFYNVPARLKHLQSQKSELSNIVSIISSFALLYPDIAFKLVNDNKILVNSNGNNDLLQVISGIYNLETAKNMEAISASNNDFKVSGFIANNKTTRSNKRGIHIFLNNRLIYNKEIEQAIIKGYGTYLMERRYPIVVLKIECDHQLIDVNVHPAKREVRISNHEDLEELLDRTIKDKFMIKQREFVSKPREKQHNLEFEYIAREDKSKQFSYPGGSSIQREDNEIREVSNIVKEKLDEVINEVENKVKVEEVVEQEVYKEVTSEALQVSEDVFIEEDKYIEETKSIEEVEYVPISFNVIGQFDATYILAQNENGLHIIDQHAAMERINYEDKLDHINKQGFTYQDLITPIVVNLTLPEKMKVMELKKHLEVIGLNFEEQANNDLILRQVPTWIDFKQANQIVQETIDAVLDIKNVRVKDIKKEDLILASCKMSLKANHILILEEQQSLIDKLVLTPNYDHCPHGRPIIITLSKYDVEKLFKRVV
ncbi:MAG: DNA mismatch repair endonuclease MutL [Erysipelotrichales bacterium]